MAAEGLQPADAVARGLGTVKVSLRRALLRKPTGQTDDLSLKRLHQAYDEKKVKMKLAHVTDLDSKCEVEAANETWDLKLHPQDDTHPFQCFLFRHNSEAVWQAAGVLKDEKTRRFGQSKHELVDLCYSFFVNVADRRCPRSTARLREESNYHPGRR